MLPKVSIILPVFNSERFIYDSIKSLLNQTFENKEIIIVDDESTDASYDIAKSFESKSCKIIKQKNAGAAIARNTGLAHATGAYIQFMDVDDFISVDKIEKQVKALEWQTNKVAVCDYIGFFDEKDLQYKAQTLEQSSFIYSSDSPVDFLINLWGGCGSSNFIQTNSWLTPRSIIDKAGGWRNYRCPDDDGEFFARVLLASEGVIYVPGVYNYYRRSVIEANLSNNKSNKHLQNTLLTIDLKHKYLLQHVNSTALHRAIATQYLNFAVAAFPLNRLLSQIAYKRYKAFGVRISPPKMGGKLVEAIKLIFGWKAARILKYYAKESCNEKSALYHF
jgi:glycosyltransferase involved in cell wall biosynthesis